MVSRNQSFSEVVAKKLIANSFIRFSPGESKESLADYEGRYQTYHAPPWERSSLGV